MNSDNERLARFEKADRRICSLWWTVGIETEIIQGTKTNRVRVRVLRKGLGTPAQIAGGLVRRPGRVAKARIPRSSIVGKSRMIWWSVEPNVAHRDSASQGHTEGLDRAIQILVMDGVFIMPYASDRARYLIDYERAAIDSRFRLDRTTGRSRPGPRSRSHSDRRSNRRKSETRRATDIVTAIGRIVIHVALPRVGLTPRVFMRTVVLNFEVVGRSRIQCWVQVAGIHDNPV